MCAEWGQDLIKAKLRAYTTRAAEHIAYGFVKCKMHKAIKAAHFKLFYYSKYGGIFHHVPGTLIGYM